jgi:hypothetical protein
MLPSPAPKSESLCAADVLLMIATAVILVLVVDVSLHQWASCAHEC